MSLAFSCMPASHAFGFADSSGSDRFFFCVEHCMTTVVLRTITSTDKKDFVFLFITQLKCESIGYLWYRSYFTTDSSRAVLVSYRRIPEDPLARCHAVL